MRGLLLTRNHQSMPKRSGRWPAEMDSGSKWPTLIATPLYFLSWHLSKEGMAMADSWDPVATVGRYRLAVTVLGVVLVAGTALVLMYACECADVGAHWSLPGS